MSISIWLSINFFATISWVFWNHKATHAGGWGSDLSRWAEWSWLQSKSRSSPSGLLRHFKDKVKYDYFMLFFHTSPLPAGDGECGIKSKYCQIWVKARKSEDKHGSAWLLAGWLWISRGSVFDSKVHFESSWVVFAYWTWTALSFLLDPRLCTFAKKAWRPWHRRCLIKTWCEFTPSNRSWKAPYTLPSW